MLARIKRTVEERGLFVPGDRVLVAVSGGPDSTALLHALVHLAPKMKVALEAAVIDHGLRAEAAGEAALVVERCRAMGVACEIAKVDVRAARGRGKHISWQDAARRERLGALEDIARRRKCNRIALGHTADDQAETVIFRIVRGTGLAGLVGIPYQRGVFVRPLLDARRRDVMRFLSTRGVSFVEDPSNADRRYTRARIRHEWLPFLARENPRVVEALLLLAAEACDHAVSGAPASPSLEPPEGLRVPRKSAQTIDRLRAQASGTKVVAIPGGEAVVSYGQVAWRLGCGGKGAAVSASPFIEIVERASAQDVAADAAVFDAEIAAQPLIVRRWQPGDRMRPRGGRGSRKLQDLLVDAKIPRPARATLPVLTVADGTILFVPGLRPAEFGRPTAATRRWLEVKCTFAPPSEFR